MASNQGNAAKVASEKGPTEAKAPSAAGGQSGTSPDPKPAKEPTKVEAVKMTDGRSVDFAGKRKMIKTPVIDGDAVSVRFDFRNGETRSFQVNGNALLNQLAAHGASQKIGDETAGETDVEDMVSAVDSIIDRLNKGDWGAERAAGGGFAGTGVVVRALMEVSGKTKDQINAWIDGKIAALKCTRQALYASLRADKGDVGKKIAELESAKAKKAVDVSVADLLG